MRPRQFLGLGTFTEFLSVNRAAAELARQRHHEQWACGKKTSSTPYDISEIDFSLFKAVIEFAVAEKELPLADAKGKTVYYVRWKRRGELFVCQKQKTEGFTLDIHKGLDDPVECTAGIPVEYFLEWCSDRVLPVDDQWRQAFNPEFPRWRYWLRQESWTLNQAGNLLLDREPKEDANVDCAYGELLGTAESAMRAGTLRNCGSADTPAVLPGDFVAWAMHKGYSPNEVLKRLLGPVENRFADSGWDALMGREHVEPSAFHALYTAAIAARKAFSKMHQFVLCALSRWTLACEQAKRDKWRKESQRWNKEYLEQACREISLVQWTYRDPLKQDVTPDWKFEDGLNELLADVLQAREDLAAALTADVLRLMREGNKAAGKVYDSGTYHETVLAKVDDFAQRVQTAIDQGAAMRKGAQRLKHWHDFVVSFLEGPEGRPGMLLRDEHARAALYAEAHGMAAGAAVRMNGGVPLFGAHELDRQKVLARDNLERLANHYALLVVEYERVRNCADKTVSVQKWVEVDGEVDGEDGKEQTDLWYALWWWRFDGGKVPKVGVFDEPQRVEYGKTEFLSMLKSAVNPLGRELVQALKDREHGDWGLPWGNGNSWVPKDRDHFESICYWLRERFPEEMHVLDGVDGAVDGIDTVDKVDGKKKVGAGTRLKHWKDLTIQFLDDYTLSWTVAGRGLQRATFSDMGMGEHKPNMQWLLLQTIALVPEKAILRERNKGSWQKVKKNTERLRKCLMNYFEMSTNPLPEITPGGGEGYRTLFTILPKSED